MNDDQLVDIPKLYHPHAATIDENGDDLTALLEDLYRVRKLDFRRYKRAMLARRLGYRLREHKINTCKAYQTILERDPTEYDKLLADLTINETSFFRNPMVFQRIKIALSANLATRSQQHLRIWSAACSTGEEAYSLAMLVASIMAQQNLSVNVEILATDIDPQALATARTGIYSADALRGIEKAHLDSYCQPHANGYQVVPRLRSWLTCSEHHLGDPAPANNFDLVLCRNVLIYFNQELQLQVFRELHKSLTNHGLLVLGEYEQPLQAIRSLFNLVDFNARLYHKSTPSPALQAALSLRRNRGGL